MDVSLANRRVLKRSAVTASFLLHQGHTGDAKEDAHITIVTLKAMVWETKARHSQAQMKETPNSNGCV